MSVAVLCQRRQTVLVPLLSLLLLPAAVGGLDVPGHASSPAETLAALPAPAQAEISRVLGRDQRGYHARSANGALRFTNDAQGLSARFDVGGVRIQSGATRIGLSLRAFGRGSTLAQVAAAAPLAAANRISYSRGPLTEWYLNGPLGLEQGFTLAQPPARGRGPLTFELALSGPGGSLEHRTALSFAGSSLRYRGLFAADARGQRVPAWLELRGRKLRIRVVDVGARYPLTIDPFLQQAKLVAAEAPSDEFGFAVAASGNTVVVGAPNADIGAASNRGAVYVFVKPGAGWANGTQTAKLLASDGLGSDALGSSVAVSGGTVVAGAPGDDTGSTFGHGSAYVFVQPGGGWSGAETQSAKLTASDAAGSDRLGDSVGVSGDTVVAGAPSDSTGSTSTHGSAYVFVQPGGGWSGTLTEQAKLTASDSAALAQLGDSVAVSGDTVVAGATFSQIGSNLGQGAAYVFVKPGGGWSGPLSEQAKLTTSDGDDNHNLGRSVAADGDTVVAGAPGFGTDQGAAYVFVKPGGGWANGNQTAKLTASDGVAGDFLGFSVAVSGDMVVAGAHLADVGSNALQGAAYVFVKPVSGWVDGTQTAKLTSSDGDPVDAFGWSVAISGDTVVAGGRLADVIGNVDEGAAYVFVRPGGGWAPSTQTAKLVAAGGDADQLGYSVAVSGDTVVAGAPDATLSSGGIFSPGAAYVFTKPGTGWVSAVQTAKLTASDGTLTDEFGYSVAIDGDTVVAGARSASSSRGAAYVFIKPGGGWASATQTAKLTASDAASSDRLGTSVAVSGDTVLAGAPDANIASNGDQGAVYVFVKPGGGWGNGTETAKLTASDGVALDRLGTAVALSADTVVAGAPQANIGSNGDQGAAYVFVKPGGGWVTGTQTAKLTAADGGSTDRLGTAVAVSGDTALAGSPQANIGSNGDQGAVYVFVKPGGGWVSATQTAKLTASDGASLDLLGSSMALAGDTAVAGAPQANIGSNGDQGAAYVFKKPVAGWVNGTQAEKLTAADGAPTDKAGFSVGISADTIVAGAPLDDVDADSDEGAVYIFKSSGPTAVRILSFTARRGGADIVLRWRTANELDTAGFNVFRERAGGRVRLNTALLPAGIPRGSTHRFVDRGATAEGPLRYRLQWVGLDGTKAWLSIARP